MGYKSGLGVLHILKPVPRRFFDTGRIAIDFNVKPQQSIMVENGNYQVFDRKILNGDLLICIDPEIRPTHPRAVAFDPEAMYYGQAPVYRGSRG